MIQILLLITLIICSSFNFTLKSHNVGYYSLATGSRDQERLSILNELYNDNSIDFLALEAGMNILTIGCGIGILELEIGKKVGPTGCVLATDLSQEQLDIAEAYKQSAGIPNVTFKQADIFSVANQTSETFDRIHCRFVLSHLPWYIIEKAVPLLMAKLKPTGALVIEEAYSIDTFKCEPFCEEYTRWTDYYKKQRIVQNSDFFPGKRMHAYLTNNNYTIVSYKQFQPLPIGHQKRIFSLGMESVAKSLIEHAVATPQELSEFIKQLKHWENNPSFSAYYTEISQFFIGRN